jgi:hypothetical protein
MNVWKLSVADSNRVPQQLVHPYLLEETYARLDCKGDRPGVIEGDPRLSIEAVRVLVAGRVEARSSELPLPLGHEGLEVQSGCVCHVSPPDYATALGPRNSGKARGLERVPSALEGLLQVN